jgi:hypothetical protein
MPGQSRKFHEQQERQGGSRKTQRTEQHGSQPLQTDLHDHEVQTPDHHHGQRAQQVTR